MVFALAQSRLKGPLPGLHKRGRRGVSRLRATSSAGSSFAVDNDLDKIPGPKGLPVLGNALEFGTPTGHQKVVEWANQWPIFKFKLLNQTHIVVTDPVEIAAVLTEPTTELPKGLDPFYSSLNVLNTPSGTPSFFTTKDPEEWAAVRHGCDPAFTPENVKKAFPMIRETVNTALDNVATRTSQPVKVDEATLRISLDIMFRFCFGKDLGCRNYGEVPILQALPLCFREVATLGKDPIRNLKFKLLPFVGDAAEYNRCKQIMFDTMSEMARIVRSVPVDAVDKGDVSLKAYLARIKDPRTGKLFTNDQLAANCAALIAGGVESPTQAAAWALYEVARHPDVQAKLVAELDREGLLWKPGKPGRQLEHDDLAKLTYLQHVKQEAIRMHPPATLAPIRIANRDITFKNGWRIPQGTFVWTSILATQNTRFNYVEPDRFWPERWEMENPPPAGGGCPHATAAGNTTGRTYMPFSQGPRNCIGRFLAAAMGPSMLASFLARFEVGVAPRMGSESDVKTKERNYLTLQIDGGTWLTLKPRDQ